MNSRALFICAALLLAVFALNGCSTENNERQRLVAEADLTNSGSPLIVAHYNDNGTADDPSDDYIPIESFDVLFSARPLSDAMVIPEGSTYSTFNVTRYDLTWRPAYNTPAGLSNYNVRGGNLTVSIPVDDEVIAGVLVGNLSMKSESWFPQPGVPFTADLEVTFYGHESSSEYEVSFTAGSTVQFVGTVSEQ